MSKVEYVKYEENLCFKCLQKKEAINTYELKGRGYGSSYDNFNSTLQLCDECAGDNHDELSKWFNEMDTGEKDYWEDYKYEDNIAEYIKSLPIQGQELFENQICYGACGYNIDSQDWIDIELKIAPDSTYKKYGYYSPSEIKAYHDRFPTCKHTYLKIYKDGSGGTICKYHFGVFGEEDGSCSVNVCSECYYCKNYEKKDFEKDKMKIERTLKVDYKVIEMIEVFCPTCGEKIHMYKDNVVHDYKDEFFCNKCHQELFINIDNLLEEENI